MMMRLIKCVFAISICNISPVMAQNPGLGLNFLDNNAYQSIPLSSPSLRGTLPSVVDHSESFPEPGFQGTQGSCVAWATSYALKSYQEARERKVKPPNDDLLFSPAYIYNQIKLGDSCSAGTYIPYALNLLTEQGAATLDAMPYNEADCDSQPSQATRNYADAFRIASWRRINEKDISEVKSHLADGFPIVIGMVVYENFMKLKDQVYNNISGDNRGGHAVVLTGYNDKLKAFRGINSWGQDWGDAGYFWMGYDIFPQVVREGYVAQDIIVDNPVTPHPITPPPLTPNILSSDLVLSGLRGSVGANSLGNTPQGWNYYPVSLWLDLPQAVKNEISNVQYWFHHSTFINPKRPVSNTNSYLTQWKGYGCINNAEVQITKTDGTQLNVPFDFCEIWNYGRIYDN